MLRIALTGGIGSGKSRVAELFVALGAGLVDTDSLARELTLPGTPTLARIVAGFGPDILDPQGGLDRARLRRRVFADPDERARLESILHPAIRDLMLERAESLAAPYALLAVPLLFETGQESLMHRVLVVDCPPSVQIERVSLRDGISEGEIRRILASQASRERRLAGAHDIIDNGGRLDALPPQVERLHRKYLRLAALRRGGGERRDPSTERFENKVNL